MRRLWIILFWIALGANVCVARGDGPASEQELITPEVRERAVSILRQTLEQESQWVKVHAAESLLELSYPLGVKTAFESELTAHESEPKYRIGIWRVLARAATTVEERQGWIDRIRAVVIDRTATDRNHALESLAKLGDPVDQADLRAAVVEAASVDSASAPYARWLLVGSGSTTDLDQLVELLKAKNETFRLVTAYALQWLLVKPPETPQKRAIAQKLYERAEQDFSPARAYLLSAAFLLGKETEFGSVCRDALLNSARTGPATQRTVASAALAEAGTREDVATLLPWLDDKDPDVRAAAAAALLRIDRRGAHRLGTLDWSVIALYFVGMLAIGWFYSFRTATTDDYLLGGRTMKPWAVGLSLFATLCSTISYLSTPGEMVQHGPMFLMSIAAYPVVTLVVGWWLIPYLMKLPVTSAYEILEKRLGMGIRLLGATFFLTMRLLWMAVILDVTTKVVLLPLLGLDASYGPPICAILGLSTVIYSSMGGIRAVVMTDVVQTFILLGGAVAALSLITWHLGGVSAWWPAVWADNWDPPTLGLDPSSRMSFFGIFMSTFFWYLCTAGSDQMAIQRYLSTRDVQSARRMFSISMITGVSVTILLSLLGLGLLAWFKVHPEMLGEGQTVANNGDQLFPRYIVAGLPDGMSGLVVAGLLAAAMSSLSSGLSSSCAVVTVDFLDRFAGSKGTETGEVRRAQIVSWSLGAVVVLLSTVVGLVKGNILEVAYKVVNLLVAPLFGLFFMALFVRWATSFGTFVGAVAGLATVVAINYWTEFTGTIGISFLWSLPLGLFVQISVGAIASLVPIGYSKPLE